jgi:hypothetical protein
MTRLKKRGKLFASQLGLTICSLALLSSVLLTTRIMPAAAQTARQETQQTIQQTTQMTFSSPSEAVQAMVSAAKNQDRETLERIFGPDVENLLSSGDPVADQNDRDRLLQKYDEMNRLVGEPDETVTLYVGAENWPFPIPLVQKSGMWIFDTEAGRKEILFRRIGRNEYATIDTLTQLAEAQKEYASQPRDGDSTKQYAQKILSDEGKHNGLYWKAGNGEPQSPIGPLVASAAAEGYAKSNEGPTPFHGYIYKVIQSQGPNAPGGAMNYMTNGKMTRGFAILAYPAKYKNSGVMTFIVSRDGKVYQKDLGPRTAVVAKSITKFNPDSSWKVVG